MSARSAVRVASVLVASLLAGACLGGCATQADVRRPLQDHLVVTGRVLGFALDAQMEALETKLAVVEADPKLEARLGKPEEIRKRIDTVRAEKLAILTELKALKDRYALDDEAH